LVNSSMRPSGTHFLGHVIEHSATFKMGLVFILTIYAHLVSVFQKPFLEPGFLYSLYVASVVLFIFEFSALYKKKEASTVQHFFEIGFIFFIFQLIPSHSSVILFVLLTYLFIVGLSQGFQFVIQLSLIMSVFYSLVNAVELQMSGAQNILSLILFNSSFFVIAFISGAVSADISTIRTDLLRTEKNLASKTALASTLMQHMPAQVYAVDNEDRIVFTNQKSSEGKEKFLKEILLHSKTSHPEYIRLFDLTSRSDQYWQVDRATYFDEALDSDVSLVLVRDQTERYHMLETLRQNEKLAAIGQLAAGIAHEIRNPLTGISGSVELLSQDVTNPDDKKLMSIILKEINRLNNLITEFLDYAKPDTKPDQVVDVSNIVSDVAENLKRSDSSGRVKIQVDLASRANVLGHADKLKQALLNIAMNAVQAMVATPEPILNLYVFDNGQVVRIKVQDNGSGMTDAVKSRIFEPFFTTKAKGTGLGLAMTHKILQAHDCKVQIESLVGVGTTFTLEFKSLIA